MIRQQIASIVRRAIALAVADGKFSLDQSQLKTIFASITAASIEAARHRHSTDFASGICFQLASATKLEPSELTAHLLEYLNRSHISDNELIVATVSSAKPQGFLNFKVTESGLCECLRSVCAAGANYGRAGRGQMDKQIRLILPAGKSAVDESENERALASHDLSSETTVEEAFDSEKAGCAFHRAQSDSVGVNLEQRRCLVFARALGKLMKFAGFEVSASFEGEMAGEYLAEFKPEFKPNCGGTGLDFLVGAPQTRELASAQILTVSDTGAGSENVSASACAARDLIIAPIEKRQWKELINRMGASSIFTQRVKFSPDDSPEQIEDKNGSELRLPLYRADPSSIRKTSISSCCVLTRIGSCRLIVKIGPLSKLMCFFICAMPSLVVVQFFDRRSSPRLMLKPNKLRHR